MPKSRSILEAVASLGLCALLAGCAAQTSPSAGAAGLPAAAHAASDGGRCFRTEDVRGWRVGDNQTVYLRTGVNRVFRMRLMGPCPDINGSERIGIEARGSSFVCSGVDATIIAPSPIGPRRCPVSAVQALSPAELAALPRRQRP